MSFLKKLAKKCVLIICVAAIVLLSGCSNFSITADDFLAPPRASGEMYDIEQALKNSVTTAYTLKYPTAGEYRSAYVLADLTASGKNEFAIAFYSALNEENVSAMHLNLMKKVGDQWISISDIAVGAIGVEKLEIADLNGDGVKEVTVGWNVYGGMDKKVMAYTLQGAKLVPLMQESYTSFICCDLMGDGREELFLLIHDMNTATATAKFYSFKEDSVSEAGSCAIDGAVASFNEPTLSMLTNGKPAVYIDAVKGTGMQTEIVYYKDGNLVAPMYEPTTPDAVSPTYRNTTVACLDINSDGYIDIPLIQPFNNFNLQLDESLLNPITRWCIYNGTDFSVSMMAVMNYADGYYFEIPKNWLERTTVSMEIESRLRTVYLWDVENGTIISELVRIRTVSQSNWDMPDNGFNEYVEIARSEGVVYAAMFSGYAGEERVTADGFKELFHLIG